MEFSSHDCVWVPPILGSSETLVEVPEQALPFETLFEVVSELDAVPQVLVALMVNLLKTSHSWPAGSPNPDAPQQLTPEDATVVDVAGYPLEYPLEYPLVPSRVPSSTLYLEYNNNTTPSLSQAVRVSVPCPGNILYSHHSA